MSKFKTEKSISSEPIFDQQTRNTLVMFHITCGKREVPGQCCCGDEQISLINRLPEFVELSGKIACF